MMKHQGRKKTNSLFKLIFRASKLPQRPKVDIFQEALFCNLSSSTNLVLKVIPIKVGLYLCRVLSFYTKSGLFLKFLYLFKEIKTKNKIFRQSWKKY